MHAFVKKLKTLRIGDVAIRRNPVFYASVANQLRELERADLATRREWTRLQLDETLSFAARSAYGRRLGATPAELNRWPLLEKSSVRSDPGAFLSGPAIFASRASTGGTTGVPLQLTRSLRSIVFEQACIDEMLRHLDVAARDARMAVLRGDNIKDPSDYRAPFWVAAAGGRRLVFSSNHLNAATLAQYAQALEEFRPDVLWAYPTTLESLCVLLLRAGRKLSVPRVLTSSEVLAPHMWRLAQEAMGSELLDYYGQAERVAFAYARRPHEYRFLPGYAHVELLPAGEEDGDILYEIVGTNLWNFAMPLPRYRTGDLVKLPAAWGPRELEEVALGLRTFTGVLGRDSDILISPEGVQLTGIDHFQRDVEHVLRIQVIQEAPDEVRILVLPDTGYSEHDAAQLMRNARAKVPASMRVKVERADVLERTSLSKTPFVIHRPAVRELLNAARRPGTPA
jgi:phenylacetate-CoA ligase